ncbi:MAG: hypothetical protein ABIO50_06885 [Nitrosospira sp.]
MEALGMGTFCESITTAAPAAQPHTALEFFLSDECKSYLLLVQCASLIAPYLSGRGQILRILKANGYSIGGRKSGEI